VTLDGRSYDVVVVGGGTAGAALAGTLAQRSSLSVLVIEAGPDYGPLSEGLWPEDLLDYTVLPTTHQWGYDSGATYSSRKIAFERARVIGGCSAHNGCAAIWGSAVDYDAWAAAGNAGWSTAQLTPLFELAMERLAVRTYSADEITPYHVAALEAAPSVGIPRVADLNDLTSDVGIAPFPLNIVDGIRFNAAFAFLDPARDQVNLSIVGNARVDRVVLEAGRAIGVELRVADERIAVRADRVVLAAGAYESPAILMRSGIGPGEQLRRAGVAALHDRPGVGENLHDHPAVVVRFAGTVDLERAVQEFATHWRCPEEQTIAKAKSPYCKEAFDLHLCPIGGPDPERPGAYRWTVMVACMDPISRGHIRLRPSDPASPPEIDHRYLSDDAGHDLRVLAAGVDFARELAASRPLASLVGAELSASAGETARPEELIERGSVHYYHPVGTCKMGPATDDDAVVDGSGQVHGIEGLYVADCSVMPEIPRANTNIPAAVVGLRMADELVGVGRA
jgi:choline dehydrogenase